MTSVAVARACACDRPESAGPAKPALPAPQPAAAAGQGRGRRSSYQAGDPRSAHKCALVAAIIARTATRATHAAS
eukprot:CAMPEP_0168456244 /NCGR_PEP_ID=MMETSP0228-20121227/51188_1 /TAXON_ID=133427 /ORGANISM="Protoceratium reticulatum, Strain CCCM 535 (=CCMP 1889)" /LENGTH=74 /DNA_ID=CAMNT_0008471159 /DNA_START=27 /DNA_END=254 /DNA_ORIENTATION=-